MANQITEASLKEALTQRLGATHVEVTDMSGTFPLSSPLTVPRDEAIMPRHPKPAPLSRCRKAPSPALSRATFHLMPNWNTNRRIGGCGQSFTSLIVSAQFEKQTSLKRHRLVNAALKDEIALIHAWSAKCQTPAEWERDRAAAGQESGPPMDGTVGGKVEGVKE